MFTTLEDLASKVETLNENTRELLYKLYLWNTVEDLDNIPVTLRVPHHPFFETFRIPTKSGIIKGTTDPLSSSVRPKSTKNWGVYSLNESLRRVITIEPTDPAYFHIMEYDGSSNFTGAIRIHLGEFTENSTLDFLITIRHTSGSSINHVVEFYKHDGIKLHGLSNLGRINERVTYSVTFKYVPDQKLVLGWRLFNSSIVH